MESNTNNGNEMSITEGQALTLSRIAYRCGAHLRHDRLQFGTKSKREGAYHFTSPHNYDGRTLRALVRRGLISVSRVDCGEYWDDRIELTEIGMIEALRYTDESSYHPDRFWDACRESGCTHEFTIAEVGTTCRSCGSVVGSYSY